MATKEALIDSKTRKIVRKYAREFDKKRAEIKLPILEDGLYNRIRGKYSIYRMFGVPINDLNSFLEYDSS
ncbi:MAG: hypothetical protein ABIA78_01205 [archaeon]